MALSVKIFSFASEIIRSQIITHEHKFVKHLFIIFVIIFLAERMVVWYNNFTHISPNDKADIMFVHYNNLDVQQRRKYESSDRR